MINENQSIYYCCYGLAGRHSAWFIRSDNVKREKRQ